jgi:hypothetical protein
METIENYRNAWEAPCDPRDEWLDGGPHGRSNSEMAEVSEFFGKRRNTLTPVQLRKLQAQRLIVSQQEPDWIRAIKVPGSVVIFYVLGLACVLTFAVLLALAASGHRLIHPFLSLLGLIGGLGWLSTAWTDVILWKRERLIGTERTRETVKPSSSHL